MTTSDQEANLLDDLAAAGYTVASVSDLPGRKMNYRTAIPILLRWLPLVSEAGLKEDIVRALSVKWAKPEAAPALVTEFEQVADSSGLGIRWAIANALAVVADERVLPDVERLVTNRKYGRSREMLAAALGNMRGNRRAIKVLIDLLDDEAVVGHAIGSLGRLRAQEARARIESLKHHPKAWVRREAKKAVAKLDK